MKNNKAEEIVKKMFSGETVELSPDDLDGVAGGVLTQSNKDTLLWGIKTAKDNGLTMEEMLAQVPSYFGLYHMLYPDVTLDEILDFIRQNWDLV